MDLAHLETCIPVPYGSSSQGSLGEFYIPRLSGTSSFLDFLYPHVFLFDLVHLVTFCDPNVIQCTSFPVHFIL